MGTVIPFVDPRRRVEPFIDKPGLRTVPDRVAPAARQTAAKPRIKFRRAKYQGQGQTAGPRFAMPLRRRIGAPRNRDLSCLVIGGMATGNGPAPKVTGFARTASDCLDFSGQCRQFGWRRRAPPCLRQACMPAVCRGTPTATAESVRQSSHGRVRAVGDENHAPFWVLGCRIGSGPVGLPKHIEPKSQPPPLVDSYGYGARSASK